MLKRKRFWPHRSSFWCESDLGEEVMRLARKTHLRGRHLIEFVEKTLHYLRIDPLVLGN